MRARAITRPAAVLNARTVGFRFALSLLLLAAASPLLAASYTSTQAGNWSSAATWGGAGVPGAGDTATVNHTVTLDIAVSVATVTLTGTITGSQPLTVTSAFNWNGGTQSGTGTTTIPSGATMTLGGWGTLDARTLSIAGTLAVPSSYYFYAQNNAVVSNSGVIDFQGDGGIYLSGSVGTTSITNSGTIKKSAGTGTATINVPITASTSSQFQVNSGSFNVGAVAATGATFSVVSGSTLNFNTSDTRSFDSASTLSGAGTVSWGSGTNTISGAYSVTATTQAGGSTTITGATALSTVTVNSGTLTLNGASTLSITNLTMGGGTLNGTAPIVLTGATMAWTGGTVGGSSTLTINSGTTITINGYVNYDTRAITSGGSFIYSSNYYSYFYNGVSFTNNGSVTFQGDGGFYIGGGTDSVVNNGTITKSGGTGNGALQVPLTANSSSQIQIQSGTVYFGSVTATGATLSVSAGATAYFYYTTTSSFDATSTISGAGTVQFGGGTNTISAAYNVTGTTSTTGGTTTLGSSITSLGTLNSSGGSLTINNSSAPTVGNITVSGGTLTLNIPATLSIPLLTMSGGTLNGTASISVTSAAMTWTGGTIGGSGTLTIPSGTTITINGYVNYDTRAITNGGIFTYAGAYYSYLYNGATFTNNGTVDFQGDGGFYIGSGSPSVVNNGTIKKSAGTGNGGLQVSLTLNTSSQLQIQSGALLLGNIASTGGSMSISSGATAYFYYTTTSSFDAASSISGAGAVKFGSGTNTIGAAYNVTGTTTAAGGSTTLSNVTGFGDVTVTGGTLTVNGATAVSIATLSMQGGTFNGAAPVSVTSAAMTWSGGTLGGTGTFTIPAGTTVTFNSYFTFDARPITNAGSMIFTSNGYAYFQNNAVLTNNGTIDVQSDGNLYLSGTAGTTAIVNNGTIKKSAGTGTTSISVALTAQTGSQFLVQSGTVDLGNVTSTGGTLNASTGATLAFYYTTTATFDSASTISGTGSVRWQSGTTTFSGTLSAPVTLTGGTLTINSASTQTIPTLTFSGGTLNGTGNVTVGAAAMTWSGGTLGGGGTFTIPSGATVTINNYMYFDARPITNAGSLVFTSNAYSYLQNNTVLTNNGTIDFQSDDSLYLNGTTGTTSIVNNGTIKKSAGTGSTNISVPLVAQSGSQFLVQSGTVDLGNVTSTGGTFNTSTGATLVFYYTTTATFDSASIISGSGTVRWQSGTTTFSGTLSANVTLSSGTLTVNSASTQTIPTLTFSGGTLNGTGNLAVSAATMTWSGGTLGGSGTFTIPAGTSVTINSYMYFDARPITNAGSMIFTSNAYSYLQNNAVLTNNGTLDFQSDDSLYLNGTTGTTAIVNNGTMKKSAGTGTSTFNVPMTAQSGSQFLVQSGTVYVGNVTSTGGTFNVSTACTLIFNYTSTATFDSASTISGTGTVQWQSGTTTFSGTLSANVGMTGGTLTINSASTQTIPVLTFSGGTLNGTANVAVSGAAMTWSGGTLGGSGTFTIPAGTTVTINSYMYFDARPVTNAGSLVFTSNAYSYLQNNTVLTNNGTIDFQSDDSLYLSGTAGTTAIVNNGTIKKSGGTSGSSVNVALKAQSGSQFLVQSGSVYLGDVTSTGGTFNISTGATLLFYYTTTATFDAASTISGAGTAQFQSGTNTFSGTFTAPLTVAGGTLSINSAAAQSLPWLAMSGGTLNGTAALSVSATSMSWSGGTLGGSGTLTIPSGASVGISGYPTIDTRPVSNAGTINLQDGRYFYMQNGAAITNSGMLDLLGNSNIYVGAGTGSITNSGTLRKSGAAGTSASISPAVTNNSTGTIESDIGTLTLASLSNTGTLSFPIGSATSYGKLAVNSALALAGTLSATTTGGYTPAVGSTFPVLTYPSASGAFATRNLSYTGGLFTDGYNTTGMILTATNGSCAAIPTGVVSWWRAEGNAVDTSGTNNGTMNGATTTNGYVGQAFNFTGSSSVNVGSATALAPPAITVEFWANPRSFANTYNNLVARWGQTNAAQNSWIFTMYQPDGKWHWDVNTSGGPASVTGTSSVVLNQWTHIAGTYDGTTAMLYVNGALVGQTTVSGTITADPTSIMSIGCKFADGVCNYGFDGLVDEVAVYNRALTATEIQGIYSAAGVGKCAPPGPTISGFSPSSGVAGTTVTISGSNFTNVTGVKFGTVAATYTVNSSTQITATAPAGGNGAITVTTTTGTATSASSFTVSACAAPTVTASGPTTFCAGGSVTLTAASGYSTYSWSNGATTQSITVTTGGSYTVTATSGSCIATSAATTVTVNPLPTTPVVTASGPTTFCSGGSVTLTAPSGFTYHWSTGATTQSINATTSGSYSVTITDANGCSSTSAVTTVTANAPPATPVVTASGPTTFCTGGSVTLSAPSGFAYLWSTNATTQSITVNASGSYSVKVTDANGCSATSAATTVTLTSGPATPTITASGPTTFCSGGSVTLSAPAGFTYLWSTSATTQSITVSASGSYSVTVKDTNGCAATSAATTVTVTSAPATPAITASGSTTFCSGGSVTLSAPAGFSAYTWSNGATTQSINVTTGGSYSVTVSNGGTCTATSAATTVTVNPLPATPAVTASGPTTFCSGGSVTLTAPAGFASYVWSNGAKTQSVIATTSGSYSVSVTDANGCSAASAATTVTVNPGPATPVITANGATTFCAGGSVGLFAPAGYTSYLWSNGATTRSINVTTTGAYSVTVSSGGTCTATSAATNVTVRPVPTLTITADGPITFCAGGSVTLSADSGYASYVWATGDSTRSIKVTSSGTYIVTVTDANGCSATTPPVTVVVTQVGPVAITAPAKALPGSSQTATVPAAPAGSTYQWTISNGTITNGQGTNSITFTTGDSGSVALGVTVANAGCSATASASVSIGASADLALSMTASSASIVVGDSIAYTINVTNSGPDPATNIVVVDTPPIGSTVSNVSGSGWSCTTSQPVTCTMPLLGVGPAPPINIVVTPPSVAASVTNTATVTSNATDASPANNSASATTAVTQPLCGTAAPTLVSPADGTSTTSPVTFTWSSVTNATSYDVWAAIDGAPAATIGSTTSTSLTAAVGGSHVEWFVGVHFGATCPVLFSTHRTLTLSTPNPCGGNAAPALVSPINGLTVSSPATFTWKAAANATGYRVWIAVDGAPAQDVGRTDGTTTTLTASVPPGAIDWYVEASFSGCPVVRSAVASFRVPRPDPCASRTATSLLLPIDNFAAATALTTFQWTPVTGASGYRVWAAVDGASFDALGTTTDTVLTRPIASGRIDWYVETLFNGCASVESLHRSFTVPRAQTCAGTAATLVAPAASASLTNGSVTFNWNAVGGAIGYELWLSLNNGTPTQIGTTTATTLTRDVASGAIDWFVRTDFDGCPAVDSAHAQFTVAPPPACTDARPLLSLPLNGARDVYSPVNFSWKEVGGATSYNLWISVDGAPAKLKTTSSTVAANDVTVPPGVIDWYVEAVFSNGCPSTRSTQSRLTTIARPTGCVEPLAPIIITPASVSSDVTYSVTWQKVAGAASYTLQESSTGDFSDAASFFSSDDHVDFRHTNATTLPVSFFYRVRATSGCGTQASPYSSVIGVSILPAVAAGSHLQGSMPVDSAQTLTYSIPIDASLAGLAFTATANEPWITITPASGIVPAGGMKLTATVNTATLPVGTSLGGVTITTTPVSGSSNHARTSGGTTTTTTVSVSLVQPVLPQPKNTPPPDALIIPAVAHADGINSKFQSDVRVTNTSPQVMKYQVTFTPTGDAGIKDGKQTTIDVDPGKTVALDDVLGAWFSSGALSSQVGTLEIRPLTTVANSSSGAAVSGLANLVTFASSRTFNVTANGTFGQYIPAIPFANFIGAAQDAAKSTILSLQQIAESSAFRTNVGIVEGSGQPANILLSIFGDNGQKLKDVAMTLQGGQHIQLNSFLGTQGLQLNDGRVEIKVTSPTGRVTAYASVLDNRTNDPLLVTPVAVNRGTTASTYVVPGVADLNNGLANWRTDMRVLNSSTTPVNATLEFYSQNGGAPHTAQITLAAGEVKQLDNLLASVFGVTNDGGALHVTTAQPSNIVATARTYNDTGHGTYGQFISAVTPNDGASLGSRPLQLLQVEESDRFRTNVGIAEVSGKPVKVQISLVPPDSRVTANVVLDLGPNEFRQLNSLVKQLGLPSTYNARVSVQVIGGQGRVTSYASVIDSVTQDPTYVPAQ